MAFTTNLSRFDLLNDDAHDPFEKKKKTPKSANTANQKKSTANAKNSGQSQGQGTVKKNKQKNKKNGSNETKDNTPSSGNIEEEFPVLGSETQIQTPSKIMNRSIQNHSNQVINKEKRPKDQWSEWKNRDDEFVTDTYEMDLEAALVQSKLEFDDEKSRVKAKTSKKTKRKGVILPLPEFNNLLNTGKGDSFEILGSDLIGQPSLNGFSDEFGQGVPSGDDSDPRLPQFRLESQMQVQRERRFELERKLLNSRSPVGQLPSEKTKEDLNVVHVVYDEVIIEKDKTIAQLTNEKLELAKEIEVLKSRFKKICSVLGDAQLKDKANLVNELEKVTKLNHDLNENIQELHGLLEQEKSKHHAALLEIRKLNEQSRRRNPHSDSTSTAQ